MGRIIIMVEVGEEMNVLFVEVVNFICVTVVGGRAIWSIINFGRLARERGKSCFGRMERLG